MAMLRCCGQVRNGSGARGDLQNALEQVAARVVVGHDFLERDDEASRIGARQTARSESSQAGMSTSGLLRRANLIHLT